MSIRPILTLGSDGAAPGEAAVLLTPSVPVDDFGPSLSALITDLTDTLLHHRIAVGLAAPQIGSNLRVFVVNQKQEGESTRVFINPRVENATGKKDKKKESCMSIPHFRGLVERRSNAIVSFVDLENKPHTLEAQGFFARILMHEIDHLDGVVYPARGCGWSALEPVAFFNNP